MNASRPRHGNTRTDIRDEVLKREWDNMTLRELAERFRCRVNTIREHANRLGLPPRSAKKAQVTNGH